MSPSRYDVVVAGLGAMGSATACRLALKGVRVLGLDRWPVGHTFGSSHGDSRIIREMYFEHPAYVPIVRRAYELWRDLEARTGRALLDEVGGLMIGPPDGELVTGTIASATVWNIPHDVLDQRELARRFPAFRVQPGDVAVVDRRAGFVRPEACVQSHLDVATAHGADLRFDEPLVSWSAEHPDSGGVRVETTKRSYSASKLLLTAGARLPALVRDLSLPLEVERQTLFWFDVDPADTRFDGSPIWAYEFTRGQICYGFPRMERGVKAAVMHGGETPVEPDAVRRTIEPDEVGPLRACLSNVLPDLAGAPVRDAAVCLFTNMPDGHFLIDTHPDYPQVLLSSPCSGHGFKFASAIGEIQADLLTTGATAFDISGFRLGTRLGASARGRGAHE